MRLRPERRPIGHRRPRRADHLDHRHARSAAHRASDPRRSPAYRGDALTNPARIPQRRRAGHPPRSPGGCRRPDGPARLPPAERGRHRVPPSGRPSRFLLPAPGVLPPGAIGFPRGSRREPDPDDRCVRARPAHGRQVARRGPSRPPCGARRAPARRTAPSCGYCARTPTRCTWCASAARATRSSRCTTRACSPGSCRGRPPTTGSPCATASASTSSTTPTAGCRPSARSTCT